MSAHDGDYAVRYANSQRNSLEKSAVHAVGELAWKKDYVQDFHEGPVSPPVALYASGSTVGIQVNPYLLIYKDEKLVSWKHIHETSRDAAAFFKDCFIYFPADGLVHGFYDYAGERLQRPIPMVGLAQYESPMLITALGKGLLYAAQFSGGPSRRPRRFTIGFLLPPRHSPEWGYCGERLDSDVLVSNSGDALLYSTKGKFYAVDMATGKMKGNFELPIASLVSASIDPTDNLVVHAVNKDGREVIAAYRPDGTPVWEHEIDGKVANRQPPVCGDAAVFYIAGGALCCCREGALAWKSELFPCMDPLMTVTAGNNVIVQSGFHLFLFDATGRNLFKSLITPDTTAHFTAPPVAAGDGLIYAASEKALYCFK
jgi:outer membrane protein assembly factor BamB